MKRAPGIVLVSLALAAGAAEPGISIPPAEQLLTTLRREHPRLLATAADFAALRERVRSDAQLRKWHEPLRREAAALLDQPPSEYRIPDGLRLLETSRRVLTRVRILGLWWQLDRDRRWADRAWQELEAAARFKDWNPRHFLDTAEMTHAFALGYDWLHDAWTAEQRHTLRAAMLRHGLTPGEQEYARRAWWSRTRNNWNQVCNGGLGMGALALAEVEPERAARLLHDALNSLPIAMAEFAPDGACIEGPGYWNYATSYNFMFLAALESALGTDFGLSALPGVDQTGWYPIYLSGPTGHTFNHADGSSGPVFGPQMFWLARRFARPEFAWYQARTPRPAPLDLLWYCPEQTDPARAGLPPDKYFRVSEVVTLRGSWTDPNATFVGFKAGKNNDSHGHLDVGTWVLDALGERWAMDFGLDDYNLPGYFGRERWNYYRLRAEGHNTLVVNPGAGPDQQPAATPIRRFVTTPGRAFAIGDLKAAVAPDARRVERGVALLDRRTVLVQDELETEQPATVWWFLHTEADITLDAAGRTATLERNGKRLIARILAPAEARFTVMKAEPLPGSPRPPGQATNHAQRKLAIHRSGVTDLRLVVWLTPRPRGPQPEPTRPPVLPLAEW